MPGQQISQSNPPPDASQLSDDILNWSIKVEHDNFLSKEDAKSIQMFRRAADYIAACKFMHQCTVYEERLSISYSDDIPDCRERPLKARLDLRTS